MIVIRVAGTQGDFSLNVSLELPGRGVTALFGPSGSGKTTILRALAGLSVFPGATLRVMDEVWQDGDVMLPPHRRPIGYVFQEASLFPHLSVRRNLDYARKRAGETARGKFDGIVDLLGIAPLMDRMPARLSGGERQRVAIGRAMLTAPRLLLMDEPLSALDRGSREEILPYLEHLHESLAIPVIYVSHDLAEVERLADTLVLLRGGRVEAAGPLAELQADPSLPVAKLPEAGVTLYATVQGFDPTWCLSRLIVEGGHLLVPGQFGISGTKRRVRLAASDISLARQPGKDSTLLNTLPARILAAEPHDGAQINVVVALGSDGLGARVLARVTRRSWEILGLQAGEPVYAQIKSVALVDRR